MDKYEKDHARQIDDIIDGMLDFTGDRTRELAGNLVIQLSMATPKDTTRTSVSWVASPARGIAGRLPPRNEVGVGIAKTAQAQSLVRLKTYKIEHGAIFVGNPLPHAPLLDAGYSRQQPRPFVGRVVAQEVSNANRKK